MAKPENTQNNSKINTRNKIRNSQPDVSDSQEQRKKPSPTINNPTHCITKKEKILADAIEVDDFQRDECPEIEN